MPAIVGIRHLESDIYKKVPEKDQQLPEQTMVDRMGVRALEGPKVFGSSTL